MKRLTFIFMILLGSLSISAQQSADTLRFMTDYRQFIAFVEAQPSFTKLVADSLMARQETLMHQYRAIKRRLNNEQVKEYNYLKGRYSQKMIAYRGNRITEGIQASGDSIAKAAGRTGSAVGGFFKGLFKKK